MRTRAIRPAFWPDAVMGQLRVADRLVYMGLWCLADDAGFFETGASEIAAALFPHDARGARLTRVIEAIDRLAEKERVEILSCGRHAIIPTIVEHRFSSGEMLFTVKKQHEIVCSKGELHSPRKGVDKVGPERDSGGLHSPNSPDSYSSSHSSTPGGITTPRGRARPTGENGGGKTNGRKIDRDEGRAEAIARAQAKLDDPSTTPEMRKAAQFALDRLEASQ